MIVRIEKIKIFLPRHICSKKLIGIALFQLNHFFHLNINNGYYSSNMILAEYVFSSPFTGIAITLDFSKLMFTEFFFSI